jgi:hypothetical protein
MEQESQGEPVGFELDPDQYLDPDPGLDEASGQYEASG